MTFDIGIMPLEDTPWEKGKCGFKIIQYLSLGIPAIASPVGVNGEIIEHGKNGFLAASEEEWYKYLKLLLLDHSKRAGFGEHGQKKIREHYSVLANRRLFFALLEN